MDFTCEFGVFSMLEMDVLPHHRPHKLNQFVEFVKVCDGPRFMKREYHELQNFMKCIS